MSNEQRIDELSTARRSGRSIPEDLLADLDPTEAYRIQFALLCRSIERGEVQIGWNVRAVRDSNTRLNNHVFGHLLSGHCLASNSTLEIESARPCLIQSKLVLTLRQGLLGPKVCVNEARKAVALIAPALEMVETREAVQKHISRTVVYNIAHKAFVIGADVAINKNYDFTSIQAHYLINGESPPTLHGSYFNEDPWEAVAWLADALFLFGRRLQAGHRILLCAFGPAIPAVAGQSIEVDFKGIGAVHLRVADRGTVVTEQKACTWG